MRAWTFPSSAGFNTSQFFYTDDTSVYFLPTRDMTPAPGIGTDLAAWSRRTGRESSKLRTEG